MTLLSQFLSNHLVIALAIVGTYFLSLGFFVYFLPKWSENHENFAAFIPFFLAAIVSMCSPLGNKFFHTKEAAAEYLIEIGCDDYEGLKKAPSRQGLFDTYYCQDANSSARFFIFYKEKKGVYGIKKYGEFYYGE
ncbi:hypothetical protein OAL85_03595 [Methylophilaceae bacterium]|nr:hypothetical protein [Methylophilaceae bacterium]